MQYLTRKQTPFYFIYFIFFIFKMTLENTSTEKLVELEYLIYNANDSLTDWLGAFDGDELKLRTELISDLADKIYIDLNYNGDDFYDNMFWYVKGLKLPQPKPLARYADSDEYLFNNLRKLKAHDVLDEFKRKKSQVKFNEKLSKERAQINTRNENYRKAPADLLNKKPLLRPLAPEELKPLKPYAQKLFEAENEELIKYFEDYGHDFESKDEEFLTINIPNDYEQALRLLEQYRQTLKDSETVTKN